MPFSSKINEIKFNQSNGASQIARNALDLLASFVRSSRHKTYRDFLEDFSDISKRLFQARSNMAPLQSLVAQILYEVKTLNQHDLEFVRQYVLLRIKELCEQSKIAIKESAEQAANMINDFDHIATCSFSSTVCESLKLGKQQAKNFKVLVAESKIGNFSYGLVLANFLKSINIYAQVFSDNEIQRFIKKSNFALVGADSILHDGSVINGTPSHKLAIKSKEYGISFYSVCETTKTNILNYLGKNVELEKGFDLIPSNLITGIITEKGILDHNKIFDLIKQKSKFLEFFLDK